jgi:membrane-associated phospholipid phosphatase
MKVLQMPLFGYAVNLCIAIVLIIGGYQFYFFVQRRHWREPIEFKTHADDKIPFRPQWIWVYSGLYYPVIIFLVFTMRSFAQFNYTAFNFLLLLAMQVTVFYVFPVRTPERWRSYDVTSSPSARFLGFVQKYDGRPNSFPSMHVSVAMLTSLHLYQNIAQDVGPYAYLSFLFPVLIATSSLYTKQHYVVDLLPGVMLGYANFELYRLLTVAICGHEFC